MQRSLTLQHTSKRNSKLYSLLWLFTRLSIVPHGVENSFGVRKMKQVVFWCRHVSCSVIATKQLHLLLPGNYKSKLLCAKCTPCIKALRLMPSIWSVDVTLVCLGDGSGRLLRNGCFCYAVSHTFYKTACLVAMEPVPEKLTRLCRLGGWMWMPGKSVKFVVLRCVSCFDLWLQFRALVFMRYCILR